MIANLLIYLAATNVSLEKLFVQNGRSYDSSAVKVGRGPPNGMFGSMRAQYVSCYYATSRAMITIMHNVSKHHEKYDVGVAARNV